MRQERVVMYRHLGNSCSETAVTLPLNAILKGDQINQFVFFQRVAPLIAGVAPLMFDKEVVMTSSWSIILIWIPDGYRQAVKEFEVNWLA